MIRLYLILLAVGLASIACTGAGHVFAGFALGVAALIILLLFDSSSSPSPEEDEE